MTSQIRKNLHTRVIDTTKKNTKKRLVVYCDFTRGETDRFTTIDQIQGAHKQSMCPKGYSTGAFNIRRAHA